MSENRKITVEIPSDLLEKAQELSGEGVTATVRAALENFARGATFDRLLALRGKVEFTESMRSIRSDRK